MKLDRRYTIARESTGRAKPQYVARFEGEWIGSSSTRAGASKLVKSWEASRWRGGPLASRQTTPSRRDPAKTGKSYTRNIDGLDVTFTYHPKSGLWGGVIHPKKGFERRGTLPGGDGYTFQEAEEKTRRLLKRSRASNDPSGKPKAKPAKKTSHVCSCSHPKPATKKKVTRRIPQGMIHVHTSVDGRRMGNYSGNKNDTIMFMDPKPKPKAKRRVARDPAFSGTSVVKECPIGTEIQTLILSQQMFNERQAAGWAKRHGFRVIKVDVTANNYRFRQHPPSNFRAGSFRTIRLRPGVEAVIGCPS